MLPSTRRLRAAALALSLLLTACAHARPAAGALPDPHVAAPTLQSAAVACASRGFAYVAHVAGHRWYCLATNQLNEPEAVAVAPLIEHAPSR